MSIDTSDAPPPRPKQRQRFTPEEDEVILAAVDREDFEWSQLPVDLPGRTARQCRERYRIYLKPESEPKAWSRADDAILKAKFKEYGTQWTIISAFVGGGRSGVHCKNRWSRLNRWRTKAGQPVLVGKTPSRRLCPPQESAERQFPTIGELLNEN
jgi:hypothetical protein